MQKSGHETLSEKCLFRRPSLQAPLSKQGRTTQHRKDNALPILHQRHPSVVAEVLRRVQSASLEGPDEATPNLAELAKAATRLQEAGFALPDWDALADGGRPPPALVERALGEPLRGWQPPRPAWTPPLARAFVLTLTRLREH